MIKNELICNNLETSLNSSTDQVPDSVSIFCGVSFDQFNVASEVDIGKIFGSSPTKSCALDPIPTWLLKQYQDQLAPVLTTIVNASLSCAEFPTERKKAFLTPLIKKMIIDCEILRITGLCLIYLSFQSLWNALFVFNYWSTWKPTTWMRYFTLLTDNFTAKRQHSFMYKMTYSKPLTMRQELF